MDELETKGGFGPVSGFARPGVLLNPDAGEAAGGGGAAVADAPDAPIELTDDFQPAAGSEPAADDGQSIYGADEPGAEAGAAEAAAAQGQGQAPAVDYRTEYERAAATAEELRGLVARMIELRDAGGLPGQAQAPAQPAAGAAGKPFDLASWIEGLKTDAPGAYAKMFDHILETRPELLEKRVGGFLDKRLGPLEQAAQAREAEARMARMQSQYQALQAEEPASRPGTPEHAASVKFVQSNPWLPLLSSHMPRLPENLGQTHPELARWFGALQESLRQVDWPRLTFAAGAYPLLQQKLKGAGARMQQTRTRVASAGSGTGGASSAAAPGSLDAVVEQALNEGAKRGIAFTERDRELLKETMNSIR